jgi:selenide,water dikinase
MVRRNVIPGGTDANMNYLKDRIAWDDKISSIFRVILCDAQTSGGLLVATPEPSAAEIVKRLKESGVTSASVIGKIEQAGKYKIFIVP